MQKSCFFENLWRWIIKCSLTHHRIFQFILFYLQRKHFPLFRQFLIRHLYFLRVYGRYVHIILNHQIEKLKVWSIKIPVLSTNNLIGLFSCYLVSHNGSPSILHRSVASCMMSCLRFETEWCTHKTLRFDTLCWISKIICLSYIWQVFQLF